MLVIVVDLYSEESQNRCYIRAFPKRKKTNKKSGKRVWMKNRLHKRQTNHTHTSRKKDLPVPITKHRKTDSTLLEVKAKANMIGT